MAITLKPEQEQVLEKAVRSGLANTANEALEQAIDGLHQKLPREPVSESFADAIRSLATFGERHGLSMRPGTVTDLLRESRP